MARKQERSRAWYAQPVVWLGALVLLASVLGAVWLIVLSSSLEEEVLPTAGRVFGVPLQSPPAEAEP